MKRYLVLVAGVVMFNIAPAQTTGCDKCDLRYVAYINRHSGSLNETMVERFLCSQDYSCAMNPRFIEISSATMYSILSKRPELVVSCLERYSYLNKKCIYDIIKSPTRAYNFDSIRASVLSLPDTSRVKRQVANCILLAGRKRAAGK